MNERIRILRTDKKLSQSAFGERLGCSRDMVNNLERGRVEIKDHIIKLICTEYGVSEDWLRYGKEPMYIEPNVFSLDDFCKQHEATPQELEAIKAYFELPPDIRKYLIKHFSSRLSPGTVSDHPDTPEELESQYPPEDATEKGAG